MNQNQKRCLDFIKGYIASNGDSPSYQEMADYLGFASKSAIFTIIKNLKDEGYIKVAKRGQRNIKLSECENCQKLEKQLDIAIRCLEKYADHQNWQDECAGAEDCLYIDDFAYKEAEETLEAIRKVK